MDRVTERAGECIAAGLYRGKRTNTDHSHSREIPIQNPVSHCPLTNNFIQLSKPIQMEGHVPFGDSAPEGRGNGRTSDKGSVACGGCGGKLHDVAELCREVLLSGQMILR